MTLKIWALSQTNFLAELVHGLPTLCYSRETPTEEFSVGTFSVTDQCGTSKKLTQQLYHHTQLSEHEEEKKEEKGRKRET